jgi:hypothetical protein
MRARNVPGMAAMGESARETVWEAGCDGRLRPRNAGKTGQFGPCNLVRRIDAPDR